MSNFSAASGTINNALGLGFQLGALKMTLDFATGMVNKPSPKKTLTYPKKLGYKKMEVMREKKKMGYPKAWDYKSTQSSFKLKFNEAKFKKFYVKKHKAMDNKNNYYLV